MSRLPGEIIRENKVFGGVLAGIAALAIGTSWTLGEIVKSGYNSSEAKEFVEQSGYTGVELSDTDTVLVGARGCGKGDAVKYEFTATSPNGTPNVSVDVCKGLFKGATIRQG